MSGIPQALAVDPLHDDDTDDGPSRSGLTRFLAPVAGLTLLFGGWELYVRLADVSPLTLPAPSRVIRHLVDDPGFYISNGWVTLSEAMVSRLATVALLGWLLVGCGADRNTDGSTSQARGRHVP